MRVQPLVRHPAKFGVPVLDKIGHMLQDWDMPERTIDPFAGVGRVHQLGLPFSVGIEIEPEWSSMHSKNIVANTLSLPFPNQSFDGLITSPCYGNRLADAHNAKDGSRRYSYTHTLGRRLHPDNAGSLQWGDKYRAFHDKAWTESLRVLQTDALLIINVSNHIRNQKEQHVTEWHMNWFMNHGCTVLDIDVVPTKRLKHGANRERVEYENVFALRYTTPEITPEEESDEAASHAHPELKLAS